MRRLASFVVGIAVAIGGGVAAQSIGVPDPAATHRPDLSGTWTGSGKTLTIRHDETRLVVTDGAQTRTYNLDGSESRLDIPGSTGPTTLTAQARWVGSALVVALKTDSPIGTWHSVEVYSVDHGPRLSVVEVNAQSTLPMMFTVVRTYTNRTALASSSPFGSAGVPAAAARSIEGRWRVDTGQYLVGSIPPDLVISVDGDRLYGMIGAFQIRGTVKDSVFTFDADWPAHPLTVNGAMLPDGTLAGRLSLTSGSGDAGSRLRKNTAWTATRTSAQ